MCNIFNVENAVIIQGATLADVERMIDQAIAKRMADFCRSLQPKQDPLVKRMDAARQLGVSLVTLDRYGKFGLLHPQHVGGRIFYRQSELDTKKFNTSKQRP